jgi:hypothetical protein
VFLVIDLALLSFLVVHKQHKPIITNVQSCLQADSACTAKNDFLRTSVYTTSQPPALEKQPILTYV